MAGIGNHFCRRIDGVDSLACRYSFSRFSFVGFLAIDFHMNRAARWMGSKLGVRAEAGYGNEVEWAEERERERGQWIDRKVQIW